jgi:hypothetical protein
LETRHILVVLVLAVADAWAATAAEVVSIEGKGEYREASSPAGGPVAPTVSCSPRTSCARST